LLPVCATLLLVVAASALARTGEKPPIAILSSFWVGPDDYPDNARRLWQHGITAISVLVTVDGFVQSCTVIGTSGSQLLDRQACLIAIARWRFEPATLDGKPVPASVTRHYRWALRNREEKKGPTPLPPEQQPTYLRPADLDQAPAAKAPD
jgi:TonB family protein